ncbi:abnormal spindle-like microcephaly-associated protein isoform X2 [Rhodamnia argentea]|uniref:Abnormal spindle-like microcephaly-associated protein isoform X2 n=1 Tax=Rhodamnia argentea TaxID=178133 RepID=A0A8B8PF56_9MYRT|nr:abnormal spindle-like microcephaly-associated protein isoform X2 [Rhodamnia argentea]
MEFSDQPSSSSLLKDISNFKTPSRPAHKPSFHSPNPQFVTASKQTPLPLSTARRAGRPSLALRSRQKQSAAAANRRLKAFELEQSQSSRKAQLKKEQNLRTLAKSLTAWLNFLFRNPKSCGCDLSVGSDGRGEEGNAVKGKRGSWPEVGVGFDPAVPSPKRRRDLWWRNEEDCGGSSEGFSNLKFDRLRDSLKEVCSFDDLKERMRVYLNLACCKDIFKVMTQVTKNIDDGRLKMKAHCPIVTDFGMKEKVIRILLCYNPLWLRIGLYLILGGDSLLPNGDTESDQDIAFLKLVIERQFLSHGGLAKAYAYNKKVEGLYRPGYYESLGNVILKRFLLVVLILDRAKSQSSLPLKYGIDGLDGGSPLLFSLQSSIKSSRQMVSDFLSSDVMHGEGNLLAHLMIVGFKVSYQQCPLIEYDFRLTDVLEDLHDGVRLCRAIQLLKQDSSILLKLVVPAETPKKNAVNCGIALQYLKQSGVPLKDEDGMTIEADDVACGDKELTLSLLWNMFLQFQLPLLIDKEVLVEEVSRVRGVSVDKLIIYNCTLLDIILNWIQAICNSYGLKIDNLESSIDGKSIWCLLDYYFRKELHRSCPLKDNNGARGEESIMAAADYTDAVHNFILSQKLTGLLGDFPEILQISDILEHHGVCNSRSVIILLVFLACHLVMKKNMDHLNFHKLLSCTCHVERRHSSHQRCLANSNLAKEDADGLCNEEAAKRFKAIQAWWQSMAEKDFKSISNPRNSSLDVFPISKSNNIPKRDDAACLIQSHYRGMMERRKFLKIMDEVSLLQSATRAWLVVRQKMVLARSFVTEVDEFLCGRGKSSEAYGRYLLLFFNRHNFVKMRRSVLLIQQAARKWISQGYQRKEMSSTNLRTKAATQIQLAWRNVCLRSSLNNQHCAAIMIQSHVRGWFLRREYLNQKQAALTIQSNFQRLRCWRSRRAEVTVKSAIIIQCYARRWICQRWYSRCHQLIVQIQSWCRGWLIRRDFLARREAAILIQSSARRLFCWKALCNCRCAAIDIQSFLRGEITRKRLIGPFNSRTVNFSSTSQTTSDYSQNSKIKIPVSSILRLQRWWRSVLLQRLRSKSAIVIQSYARGWIAKRKAARERDRVVLIQSYWKGYLIRKESRAQVADLRLRVQKAAENVDDNMRIINRLKAALSELLNIRSVSSILHTCATLDMATQHSQKCCEKLVEAGAIDKLLKLIRSMTRSIPDQEVLKHALSTLRNLARYTELLDVLIDSNGSIDTIFFELLRNKEDRFFIASELLKRICTRDKGVEALHQSPSLLKRLNGLVEELMRRVHVDKRNGRVVAAKENTEKRLKEMTELLKLLSC